jgi:hypothetical protein
MVKIKSLFQIFFLERERERERERAINITLGLLTGELAVSSKESSREISLALVFLKVNSFGKPPLMEEQATA